MEEVIYLISLSDKRLATFSLGNIFTLSRGKRLTKSDQSTGKVPYISSTAQNNGVAALIDTPSKKFRSFHSFIGVNNSGSVGAAFYHTYPAIVSDHVTALMNRKLNQYNAIFITTLISKSLNKKFSFNHEISDNLMRIQKIMLPIDSNDQPDWQFMEDYISEKLGGYNVPSLETSGIETISLKDRKWNSFYLNSVVTILGGKRLTKKDIKNGKTPFIGATDSNNGITAFSSKTNESLDQNTLGVNYNGSVVDNFYHPYKAIFSDDVKRIHIKNVDFPSAEMYFFLKTVILKQKNKYQYGYKFNSKRMNQQKIMLPIDSNNQPDWQFMEDYIKSLPNANLI